VPQQQLNDWIGFEHFRNLLAQKENVLFTRSQQARHKFDAGGTVIDPEILTKSLRKVPNHNTI
jgi:hypothetical protein